MRRGTLFAGFAALMLPGVATAQSSDEALTPAQQARRAAVAAAAQDLRAAVPGVRLEQTTNHRVWHGKPMAPAATAEQSAALWLARHADALGVADPELLLERAHDVSFGKFTVFAFSQTIDGFPVEGAWARLLTLTGDEHAVVLASATLANPPALGRANLISAAEASQGMQARPASAHLPTWSEPELVVYFDAAGGVAETWAWKFVGEDLAMPTREMWTFFVDAASGALLEQRDEIQHVDVDVNVNAQRTPGILPDIGSNPPQNLPVAGAEAEISGGSSAFTDHNGDATIPHGGTTAVQVLTGVTNSQWVSVDNTAGGEITASVFTTPPGPANLTLNSSPTEFNTSQANAAHHTTLIHDFFRDRAPGFPAGLDVAIPAFVNWDFAGGLDGCNAFFDPGGVTINFFREKNGCVNSAYSGVISHEYGHFVVQTLGLGQGGFGEGFGDSCTVLLYDTGLIGPNFFLSGGLIRNIDTTTVTYPCSSGGHTCGQVLARAWRNIRNNFGATYGSATGLELAQQLMVDWSQITGGGSGTNGAHPTTAIEVLTVDDDNGDIDDGTPNYSDICAAFADRNIDCPPLALVNFVYPDGLPAFVTPGEATEIDVNVVAVAGTPTAGTGTVSYRIGGGGFTTVAMAQNAPNQYTATLPAADCPESIEFYFSSGTSGGTVSDPDNAPAGFFATTAAFDLITTFEDDVEADLGWTMGVGGDTATTGIWNRMNPEPTAAQPGDDHTPDPGVTCFVTDGFAGTGLGDRDVDGGVTTLLSPVIDLSGAASASISYWRWYSNDTGAAPNADTFRVDISNGGAWQRVETVGPSGPETSGGWFFHEFKVEDFVTPNASIQVRFIAADEGTGSLVEAAVDDFRVATFDCTPPAPCPEDLDGSGAIDLPDVAILLANFGTASGADPEDGDLNGDGAVDLTDLALMLAAFGTVCA